MALIQSDAAFFDDARDDAGFGRAGADGANAVAAALGDFVNLGTHFRGGEKGVFAAVHRRAAGMRGLAVKRDRVAFDAKSSEHRAERQIQIQKHRALLDVQFQIRGGIFQFLAGIFHALEIHADFFQRVGQVKCRFCLSSRALRPDSDCRNTRTSRTDFFQTARLLHPPNPRAGP